MLKPRRALWPPELGPADPTSRARTVARGYRALAVKHSPAGELAALDALTRRVGEGDWLLVGPAEHVPDGPLTRDQVARLAGVDPPTVTKWATRGIRRNETTYTLRPGPGGLYEHDVVLAFLRLRDTRAAEIGDR